MRRYVRLFDNGSVYVSVWFNSGAFSGTLFIAGSEPARRWRRSVVVGAGNERRDRF